MGQVSSGRNSPECSLFGQSLLHALVVLVGSNELSAQSTAEIPAPAEAHQQSELWEHLSSSADLAESRYLRAEFQQSGNGGILKLAPVEDHMRYSAWVSIAAPEQGWDLGLKGQVMATARNSGSEDVDVVLWVVSSHGWDAVGSKATLMPGESARLSCDLRESFPDGTPKLDPGRVREIRFMLQRAGPDATVEFAGLVAAGSAEPWVRPPNRLDVPDMEAGAPNPGRRVRYQIAADAGTPVYCTLYLPPDWEQGRRYPVIVEFPGNIFYRAGGCWSTGRPEQCAMGYGITRGERAIWVSLPFVDRETGDIAEDGFGSDAGRDTTVHASAIVDDICVNWGGDRERLFICGFSRGSIACGYIGLANDEIASLWKGIIGCQHYDGSNWNQSNLEGAVERAPRFKGSAIFQVDNDQERYRPVQEATRPEVSWTWRSSGLGFHATTMFLDDRPLMKELREWFRALSED